MTIETNLIGLADSLEALALRRAELRRMGGPVGFVPTMGALHAGHLTLVERALERSAHVVVSIFVNPTQFGPGEDFGRYPRTLSADVGLLESLGRQLTVFVPPADEIYHPGEDLRISEPSLSARWEGAHRPGHFDGVCLVLAKLFHLVSPDAVYLGRKDFQQTVVVRRMIRDLFLPIEAVVVPTVREDDGLALSSRNRYLSTEERAVAPRLHQTLQQVKLGITRGVPVDQALAKGRQAIEADGRFRLDYLALVDGLTLEPVEQLDGAAEPAVIVAAQLGSTRLLDNLPVGA